VGETKQNILVETPQQEATGPVILVVTTTIDETAEGETKAPGNTVNDPNIEGIGRPAQIDVSSVASSDTMCEISQKQAAFRATGWDIFQKIVPKKGPDIEAGIDIKVDLVIIIGHPAAVRGVALNLAPNVIIR